MTASTPRLAIGDIAPDVELPRANGAIFRLSALRGGPIALYFYPRDDTQGCTLENMEFSALLPEFTRCGAVVAGISPDTVASHNQFRAKHAIDVSLLADPAHLAIAAYGVWGPKTTFGKAYEGLIRTTFLIDRAGKIARIWTVKRVKGHADEVLGAIQSLAAPGA